MRKLVLLFAALLVVGCGEKSSSEVSVNPNLKYETEGVTVTITGCDGKASGELIIPATIEGKTVTSIGINAFGFCDSLTSITTPDSVTSIGRVAFSNCSSLTTIEVGAGNVNYTGVNGVLFNKEKTTLYTYPRGKTGANYTIPDSVTSIGRWAFGGCKSLTSITIPDSVTSIGEGAFAGCWSLTSITIGDGVTSIGNEAFGACISLTSITIGDSVTSIGNEAFGSSGGVVPGSKLLTSVTFLGDAPKVGNDVFYEYATPTIYRKPEAKGWGETFAGRPVKLISEKP